MCDYGSSSSETRMQVPDVCSLAVLFEYHLTIKYLAYTEFWEHTANY